MITAQMLKDKRACSGQIELFKELFPNGVEVTEEICVKHVMDFNWYWAAEHLLVSSREEFSRLYNDAFFKYREVINNANREMREKLNQCKCVHKCECGRECTYKCEYTQRVLDDYDVLRGEAGRVLEINIAKLFARLYISERAA